MAGEAPINKSFLAQLIETGEELDHETIQRAASKGDDESLSNLVSYIRTNPSNARMEQVLLSINFDLVAPENFDTYDNFRTTLRNLLSGQVDEAKLETARLLLKSIEKKK